MKSDWLEHYGERPWVRPARTSPSDSYKRRVRQFDSVAHTAGLTGRSGLESLAHRIAIVVLFVLLAWSVFIERMDGHPGSLEWLAIEHEPLKRCLIATTVAFELCTPTFLFFERTRRVAAVALAVDLIATTWLFGLALPGPVSAALDPTGILVNTALIGMCLLIYADRRGGGRSAAKRSSTPLRDSIDWR